jgi:hypothetical protein
MPSKRPSVKNEKQYEGLASRGRGYDLVVPAGHDDPAWKIRLGARTVTDALIDHTQALG